jgi:ketosteroid isomerase-like protein
MIRKSIGLALAAALLAASPAAAANPEDGALNQVYDTVARGKAEGAVETFVGAFGERAVVLDHRPGPTLVGPEFRKVIEQMAPRLKADGVKVDARYRVERRVVDGDVAIDSGYMRQAMVLPDGRRQVRYMKFLVTMRRHATGWKIVADASMPSTEEMWNAIPRSEGLKHDS